MKVYQDIKLIPDPCLSINYLWGYIFQQLHFALVANKIGENKSEIAVDFPYYSQSGFGSKLRLLAPSEKNLVKLDIEKWMCEFYGYIDIHEMKDVPENSINVRFYRRAFKSYSKSEVSIKRKAEFMHESLDPEQKSRLKKLLDRGPKMCDLPFICIHSQNTKFRSPQSNSKFPIFIQREVLGREVEQGEFNCYGLSKEKKGFIPHFVVSLDSGKGKIG